MARDREQQQSIQEDQEKYLPGVTKQRPLRSNTPLNSPHQQATRDRKRSRLAENPTEARRERSWTCPPNIPAPVRGRKRLLPEDSTNPPRKRPRKPTSYKRTDHSSDYSKLDFVEAWLESSSSPEIYTERMDAGLNASLRGSRKPTQTFGMASRSQSRRSLSRRSTAIDDQETSTQVSQKTTCTAANYRFTDLARAGIFVEGVPPSKIQEQIDSIVEHEISLDREKTIAHLASQFCHDFSNILPGAAGEDDCLELLYKTLSTLFPPDKIMHTRKAGIARFSPLVTVVGTYNMLIRDIYEDWRPSLKPRTRSTWNFSFLDGLEDRDEPENEPENEPEHEPRNEPENEPENEPDGARNTSNSFSGGVIPRKRAQAEYLSLQHSNESDNAYVTGEANNAMAPPRLPCSQPEANIDNSRIKTPRPDITFGISHNALVQGLHRTYGLDLNQASYFLEDLQRDTRRREGREEPILCSEPTQRALRIRFPFLIVEGKSYATGKHIFDAENQAATAGACALKIQRDLDDLAERASKSAITQRALVFSICTQGPYHELWAHYTVVEGKIRKSYMVPIKTCRAPIIKEVKQWLLWVDNVMKWGASEFLEAVVERLGKLARRANGVT